MNSEQDCKSIRRQAIIMFSHDFAGVVGILGGCSHCLNSIATKESSYDNNDISELLEIAKDHQQHSESTFTAMIDYMKSSLENCVTELSVIIEQMNTVYQDDLKSWYVYLTQLEIHYLETSELDIELTNLLIHHAGNLTNFRIKLQDELIKL